jgi:hypothetical protein
MLPLNGQLQHERKLGAEKREHSVEVFGKEARVRSKHPHGKALASFLAIASSYP